MSITADFIVGQNYVGTSLDTTVFTVNSTNINFTNSDYRIYGGGGTHGGVRVIKMVIMVVML